MTSEFRPVEIFNQSFPEKIQRAILRCVVTGWNQAHRWVRSRFDEYSAHDLIGHERRATVEHMLRALAKRHAIPGADGKLNHALNSFHTELVCGRTVLTASAVEGPDSMVREALFRNTIARDPQGHLFITEAAPPPDDPLYGIVLYGPPKQGDQKFPGFVQVSFPDTECKKYLGEPVDLQAKFKEDHASLIVRLLAIEKKA